MQHFSATGSSIAHSAHLCTESPCSTPAVAGASRHTTQVSGSASKGLPLPPAPASTDGAEATAAAAPAPSSECARLGGTAGVLDHQESSSRRGADWRRPDTLTGRCCGRPAGPAPTAGGG